MSNKNIFLTSREYASHVTYWKSRKGLSDEEFRLHGNKDLASQGRLQSAELLLDQENRNVLKKLAGAGDLETFILLLSGFYILLAKYSRQPFVAVHTPLLKQGGLDQLPGQIVPLAGLVAGSDTIKALISSVNDTVTQSYQYQDLPAGYVLDAEDRMLHSNVFIRFDAVHVPSEDVSGYDLVINIRKEDAENTGVFTIELAYNAGLFDKWFVRNLVSHYNNILSSFKALGRKVHDIAMLSAAESNMILHAFNDNAAVFPVDTPIQLLFEEQAAARPDAKAVITAARTLSYRQLNEMANMLARELRDVYGIRPGDIVGLMLDRSEWMIVGMLGVIKAGGAYLPLEPELPGERISYMLSDSRCNMLILQSEHLLQLEAFDGRLFAIDVQFESLAQETGNIAPVNCSTDPVYVIYTSGSTGNPKGVPITGRSLLNTEYWRKGFYGFDECFVTLQYASFSFDSSVNDIFSALLWGGALIIPDNHERLEVGRLSQLIREHGATNFNVVPGLYRSILNDLKDAGLPLKVITLAGEKLPEDLVEAHFRVFPDVKIINEYGPTENAICSTACVIADAQHIDTTIGAPIANTQVYILDDQLHPMPVGLAGEICLSGNGLADGYLNRPDLTADRFIPHPFRPAGKLYRTGDIGKWLPDGRVVFLGRKDDQVKIRGHRIEPGEIEHVMRSYPGISAAVVIARELPGGVRDLVAYYTKDVEIDSILLQQYLRSRLPDYMVPAYYIPLAVMPLTASKKLDRRALPEPGEGPGAGNYTPPSTKMETLLAAAWEDVLRKQQVGIHDDFFSIGGDSIKAIQIASRMHKAGYKLEVRHLFEHPVIADLAPLIKPLTRIPDQSFVVGEVPLTPIQKEVFMKERVAPHHYNQSVLLAFNHRVEKAAIMAVFQKIQEHHDALRMTFRFSGNGLTQVNNGPDHPLAVEEWNMEDAQTSVPEICNGIQRSIDLEKGPLMKLGLLHNPVGSLLFIVIHHLVMDTVSWRILFEDIETLYRQYDAGEPLVLPLKTDSFRIWSEKLSSYANTEQLLKEREYWQRVEQAPRYRLPVDLNPETNYVRDSTSVSFSLTAHETFLLLNRVNSALNTEINDILLTAMALSFSRFTGGPEVLVALEGHGREEILEDVDISRTVGWFTATYPVVLDVSGDPDPAARITKIKEYLRGIPNKGVGYGILKYLSAPHNGIGHTLHPDISFNFLGQFDTGAAGSLFEIAGGDAGGNQCVDEQRPYLIEVSGMIAEGILHISLTYNKHHYREATMEQLCGDYRHSLTDLIYYCSSSGERALAPADLTYKGISAEKLQALDTQYGGISDIYTLSPMQEGLFFHALLDRSSFAYFEQISYRLHGDLKPGLMERSINELFRRHGALRTAFLVDDFDQPVQVLLKERKAGFYFIDISGSSVQEREDRLQTIRHADVERSFDLAADPLMRVTLIRSGPRDYEFIWSHHHIIMDGWCTGILLAEYFEIYNSFLEQRPYRLAPAGEYRTYINWLAKQDKASSRAFWKEYLEGYSRATMIRQAGALPGIGYRAARKVLKIDTEKTAGINRLAAALRVTPNTVFQVLWGALLSAYNGTGDVVFGAVVSGRPSEITGVETMVGLFINTIPVRMSFPQDMKIADLLKQVQKDALNTAPHHHFPLSEIQVASGMKQTLFDHILIFENFPLQDQIGKRTEERAGDGKELEISDVAVFERTGYDMNVMITPGKQTTITFNYNAAVFDGDFVDQLARCYRHLAGQLIEDPDMPVRELELLPGDELARQLQAFNNTAADFRKEAVLHGLFEEQADLFPDMVALRCDHVSLSYRELNEAANRVAAYLKQQLGVQPGDLLGLMADRSPYLLIGMLAIMKSGGAYLPLDPGFPRERLAYIAEDSGMKAMLTQRSFADKDIFHGEVVMLDEEAQFMAFSTGNPVKVNTPSDLIYVMYTSGSTGKPKGVEIMHRSVINLLDSVCRELKPLPGERLLAVTTYSFDISVLELFTPLLNGACLVLASQDTVNDPFALQQLIGREQPTVMQATPGLWSLLIESGWQGSAHMKVLCGGERLTEELGLLLLKRSGALYNMYGPTETTIWSAYKAIRGAEDLNTIGKPIANTEIYILDEALALLPLGVKGDLYIGGDGLARGYRNRETLTAERFIAHPFKEGERLYRTGDLACWLSNGDIAFFGRKDNQVKLRGYRIEMGEIESVLLRHHLVKEAIVVLRDTGGEKLLAAYIIGEGAVSPGDLRTYLQQYLPAYMVPSYFIFMKAFPQTPNGKADRDALPPLPEKAVAADVHMSPVNEWERQLAGIWQEILGYENIGIRDNFFELGGHSLKAIRLMAAIYKMWHVKLELKLIFLTPILEDMARLIAGRSPEVAHYTITPLEESDHYELSPIQEQMWIMHQVKEEADAYILPGAYLIKGRLNAAAFNRAWSELIKRHEILRTRFLVVNGEPRQKVFPFDMVDFSIGYTDLRNDPEREVKARQMANEEARTTMDLEKGPLLRAGLIQLEEQSHLFLLTMHHIVTDDWSMEVMIDEIFSLYNAFSDNQESPLAPLDIQYRDYAHWQNRRIGDGAYDKGLRFWMDRFSGGVPVLDLRTDFPRPPVRASSAAGEIVFTLDAQMREGIGRLSAQSGATPYMTLLASLNVLLAWYTGQTDIVLGSPFAGRESPQLENQLGPYLNMLAVRTKWGEHDRFTDLLDQTRENLLQAFEYGMFPMDKLANELALRNNTHRRALFSAGFTWHTATGMLEGKEMGAAGDLRIEHYNADTRYVKTDLWLHAWDAGSQVNCALLYDLSLFKAAYMAEFAEDLKAVLERILLNPGERIDRMIHYLEQNKKHLLIMKQKDVKTKAFDKFFSAGKQSAGTEGQVAVRETSVKEGQPYPLVIQAGIEGLMLNSWIKEHLPGLKKKLAQYGALLFRGFHVHSVGSFREFAGSVDGRLMDYMDQSSPRSLIDEKLYTSTDHPADQVINMHNELSYSKTWPMNIMFYCAHPSETGGETPVCDSRQVLSLLSDATKRKFSERGIIYVRNLVKGFGLSWQEVYQTEDRQVVEAYCNRNNIGFEWINDQHLRIKWMAPAILQHPVTGESVWFNHGLFFNENSLQDAIRDMVGSRENLPFNTFYGDGTEIEREVVAEIRDAYERSKQVFTWKKEDVLLLDNMLMSHGRNPFTGKRSIVVAMSNPCHLADLG